MSDGDPGHRRGDEHQELLGRKLKHLRAQRLALPEHQRNKPARGEQADRAESVNRVDIMDAAANSQRISSVQQPGGNAQDDAHKRPTAGRRFTEEA